MTLKPLPPHLEELWELLQAIQKHPGYSASLDTPFMDEDEVIMHHFIVQMPRSWLRDGREHTARESAAIMDRLLNEFPSS